MKTLLFSAFFVVQFHTQLAFAKSDQFVGDLATLPPVTCPAESEPKSFSLFELKVWPSAESVAAKIPKVSEIIKAQAGLSLRLDTCENLSTEEYILKRVLFRSHDYSPISLYDETNSKFNEVKNLKSAIFGDLSEFKLVIEDPDRQGLIVVGVGDAVDNGFVAAVNVQFTDNKGNYVLNSSGALVGALQPDDAFNRSPCKSGATLGHSKVSFGSAELSFDFCMFLGGGETTGFTIEKVTLVDKNNAVPAMMRGVEQIFEGPQLEQALKYQYNHHNACDSIVLSVPALSAVYAATSAPIAGCGTSVEGAPERKFNEGGPNATKALYRVDYQGQVGTVQALDRSHFIEFYKKAN